MMKQNQPSFARFAALRFCAALPFCIALLVPTASIAEDRPEQKLERLSDEIENRKAKQAALEADAERLKAQAAALRKRVIALATDLQNIDAERDRLEERLSDLAVTENQLDADLQEDRAALSRLLAGLQAMQQQPAPAFAVHAEDALKAVQGAISVAAVVPHMQSRADGLRDRLTELSAIRRRMDLQSEALLQAEQDGAIARRDLDAALAQKKAAETKKRSAAAREAAAIAKLVREARDLRDLARKLGRRNLDTAPPSRGSRAFARARGLVPLPVSGQLASRFGLRNENGVTQKGVMIAARAGAQVTAPYDAQVLYSGPFRQYGEIVILGLEGGFQMILAGLERADGFVGQELLAGEPIGILADGDALGRELGASTSGRSQLYMELRFKGDPIDPTPWLKQTG
jgi:septal ring factor EnvC (AmiA/AmiB activator)